MEESGRWWKQADHVKFIVERSVEKLGSALETELLEAVLPVQRNCADVGGVHGQAHLPDPQFAARIGQSFGNELASDAERARTWLDVHPPQSRLVGELAHLLPFKADDPDKFTFVERAEYSAAILCHKALGDDLHGCFGPLRSSTRRQMATVAGHATEDLGKMRRREE